jgi:hypothetical protein
MDYRIKTRMIACVFAASCGSLAAAQSPGGPPTGWSAQVDGLYVYQGDSDFSDEGSFSAGRGFLRAGGLYTFDSGNSAGLSLSLGRYFYDFDTVADAPWDDINDLRVSVPLRFRASDRVNVFVAPSLRYDYETDADASDGETYGLFGGVTWRVSDALTIGPGFGAFSQIGDDSWDFFPALLVDWEIADRWNLSTAQAPGATQGPGLSLTFQATDQLRYGLTARYENVRFRLDDDGIAPGGVGEDTSVPVALSLQYAPNPATSFSAFVGAEFGGELTLEEASGNVVDRRDYDTAPIAGLSFRLAF